MARRTKLPAVPIPLRMAIGAVLRRLRKSRKWNLSHVARAAGCSFSYLSGTEVGSKETCSITLLVNVLRVYEIKLSQFFLMAEAQMAADQAAADVLAAANAEPEPLALAGWSADG